MAFINFIYLLPSSDLLLCINIFGVNPREANSESYVPRTQTSGKRLRICSAASRGKGKEYEEREGKGRTPLRGKKGRRGLREVVDNYFIFILPFRIKKNIKLFSFFSFCWGVSVIKCRVAADGVSVAGQLEGAGREDEMRRSPGG